MTISAGRIAEVDSRHASGIVFSRFGVIPKRGQPNQWRLILDSSYPPGNSINDGVQQALSSLRYVSVDDAVQQILQLGRGTLLAKVDVKHAYRNVPIHPDDRHLLGMAWRGRLFVDKTLPFGLRSAPKIFTALADALQWVLQDRGVGWLIHYIDDFLTAGKPASPQCQQNLTCIEKACADLGVPLKREKVVGPTTSLDFLGIVLDTEAMELHLPDEKVTQLKGLLEEWLVKKSCRKRELLLFIGKLANACKIVRVGRIFLRRFIDYSMKAKRLDHWIHLSIDFREDVAWWQAFLQTWNHRSTMHLISHGSPPNVIFSSDASGKLGLCGSLAASMAAMAVGAHVGCTAYCDQGVIASSLSMRCLGLILAILYGTGQV